MSKWTKRIAKMALGVMVVGLLAGCGSSPGNNYTGSWWAETRDSVTGKQTQIITVDIAKNGDNYLVKRQRETFDGVKLIDEVSTTHQDGLLVYPSGMRLTYVVADKTILMPWGTKKLALKKSDSNTEAEKTAIRNRPDWKNRI